MMPVLWTRSGLRWTSTSPGFVMSLNFHLLKESFWRQSSSLRIWWSHFLGFNNATVAEVTYEVLTQVVLGRVEAIVVDQVLDGDQDTTVRVREFGDTMRVAVNTCLDTLFNQGQVRNMIHVVKVRTGLVPGTALASHREEILQVTVNRLAFDAWLAENRGATISCWSSGNASTMRRTWALSTPVRS